MHSFDPSSLTCPVLVLRALSFSELAGSLAALGFSELVLICTEPFGHHSELLGKITKIKAFCDYEDTWVSTFNTAAAHFISLRSLRLCASVPLMCRCGA